MKKELMISYKDIKTILIIALILAFIFGYNDGKPNFILKDWLLNLFYIFILAIFISLFSFLGYKLTAKHLGTEAEVKIWNTEKFERRFSLKKIGSYIFSPVLSILVTLFSNGGIFFTPVSTFEAKNYEVYGKKFPKVTYMHLGLIALGGLFFNFLLMVIFKILTIDKGVMMSAWFMLWNLLPFSNLPGSKIFFASRTIYVFTLIFFIANVFFIQNLSILATLIISVFFSILFATVYFYFFEYLKA